MAQKVQFTETVLRDANQSLMATRMAFSDMEGILSTMDKASISEKAIRVAIRDWFASRRTVSVNWTF